MTEKEEIQEILEVFTTDGWKFMIEDIKKHYDAINEIDGINTVEELNHIKGQRHSLAWILGFRDWYQNALDNLEAENADV